MLRNYSDLILRLGPIASDFLFSNNVLGFWYQNKFHIYLTASMIFMSDTYRLEDIHYTHYCVGT